MEALVSIDTVERGTGHVFAPVGRLFTGPLSAANGSVGLLCLWRAYRCCLCPHGAPCGGLADETGVGGTWVCGGFTSFFPVISLVRNVAGSSEIIQLAVVVGHDSGSSGFGMVASVMEVGGALGMEVGSVHAGVHSWTWIAVGRSGI